MNERKETASLKVNPKVWKEVKKAAIDWDITVSELVEKAVLDWIKKHSGASFADEKSRGE